MDSTVNVIGHGKKTDIDMQINKLNALYEETLQDIYEHTHALTSRCFRYIPPLWDCWMYWA